MTDSTLRKKNLIWLGLYVLGPSVLWILSVILFSGGGEKKALSFSFPPLFCRELYQSEKQMSHSNSDDLERVYFRVTVCRNVGIEEAEEIVQWPRAATRRTVSNPGPEALRGEESHVGANCFERRYNLRLRDTISQRWPCRKRARGKNIEG